MTREYLQGTQIEIIRQVERGKIKHILFDFDGTISLLREGWQAIMAPVCVEMICGDTQPTDAIREEVNVMIDETTGIQTIFQMQRLQEMVRSHGFVPESEIRTPEEYKEVYNDRLMVPVRERLAAIEKGERTRESFTVKGSLHFLELLSRLDVTMYVFSGTDREDVRNEAACLGVASHFNEIWGALPSVEEYSKEKIIREIISQHKLEGPQVLAIGDGPVELQNVRDAGGIALGIASDEVKGEGWDEAKRVRLMKAGADILVPDFKEADKVVEYLFP
ncbi:MAG: HAD family hydrolase [Candidatus Hydrogenedens sp.]|jgi:phosphoglycolate phosphatase-like HAD superfamily hydrolase|nr:HAD family hydrolase [Candidatus Hydrogenedens sp.]